MTNLGPLLRRLRADARLTQEELADRSGVSTRTVSDLERGLRRTAYRDTAMRLANALDLGETQRAELLAAARRPFEASSTLPIPATTLIGRDAEVAAVLGELRGGARLVTLLGPGGVGKTRLALAVAAQFGGAHFVQLGDTLDPHLVPSVIARTIGVSPNRDSVIDLIASYLAGVRTLLLLDTFEHVLEAASAISTLLAVCPDIQILATSRAPLRIRAETVFTVRPLPAPVPSSNLDPHAWPATALFVERALTGRADLDPDPAAVADICRRVDGLPLAIELAAAHARHLPIGTIRDRLCLALLADGPRDLPVRHRAMRDTIAWSYDLLDARGQALLRRLSPFAGFTLEAAEHVSADPDVLGRLGELVDQSLIELQSDGTEAPRYRMLDVIGEYAAEQCAEHGEATAAVRAHAIYCISLAERAAPELRRRDQDRWHRRIDDDLANLRLAESMLVSSGDADGAIRMAGSLWMFWLWHGGFTEGRAWLQRALTLDPDGETSGYGTALGGAGALAWFQADYAETGALGERLVARAEAAGEPVALRNGLTLRGMSALALGRINDAVTAYGHALAVCPAEAEWQSASSRLNLGTALLYAGKLRRAEELLADAATRYAALGDHAYESRALRYRAACAVAAGETNTAGRLLHAGLTLISSGGDSWGLAEAFEIVAVWCAARADAHRCALLLAVSGRLREETGTRPFASDVAFSARFTEAVRTEQPSAWSAGWAAGTAAPIEDVAASADALLGSGRVA